jgi:Meiotically up-regulated gene 113
MGTNEKLYKRTIFSVYVIQFDTIANRHWKIGVTEDPIKRIKQLQTGNPYELVYIFVAPVANPYGIEASLHTLLHHLHDRDEWFWGYEDEHHKMIDHSLIFLTAIHEDLQRDLQRRIASLVPYFQGE